MKYYRYLLMAALLFSANTQAFQPNIEIIEQFDNLKMVAFISVDDLNQNPQWNPDTNAPPLTIVGAIQAVKNFKKTTHNIKEIELRLIPHQQTKWHYLIKIENPNRKTKYDIYVVLMSGKVIPAAIEPQGYK